MKTLGGLCGAAVVFLMLCASAVFGAPVEVIGDLFIKDPELGVPAGIIFGDQSRQVKACYGTVTSVGAGFGLTGGPVTTSGALAVDFAGSTGGANTAARSDHTHNYDAGYVNVGGDTMTGALTLPANGLAAGTTQFVLNSGNVGIGIAAPTEKLHLVGNLKLSGDIKTDRWQNSDTNTFMGVGVAGKGDLTLGNNPFGLYNTAVGNSALYSIYNGYMNTAFGHEALYSNNTGSYNTAVGSRALRSNTVGGNNIAIGDFALFSNVGGERNVAVGYLAGNASTGDRNLFLGHNAGYGQTGSDRLYIANSPATPLLYGQFDTRQVCIDCTDPAASLDVNGSVTVRTGDVKLSGAGGGVMFPDGSKQTKAAGYVRTVLVSPGETAVESGTRLLAALAGITDNGPTKPYLVKIEPGIYDVVGSSLGMKQFVDIEGSGETVTVISGAIGDVVMPPNNATVVGADNAEIRFLTVKNTGVGFVVVAMVNHASPKITNVTFSASGDEGAVGVVNNNSSPTLTNVKVEATAADSSAGVWSRASSPTMTNVTAAAGGGVSFNAGVFNSYCSETSPTTMTNVTATAKNGGSNSGVYNVNCPASSFLTMTNVIATARDGTNNHGVYNASSFLRMTNVTAEATSSGGAPSFGVYNIASPGSVKINHSVIKGATNTVANVSGGVLTMVGNTQLDGGPVYNVGMLICAGVYDENYTFYASTCP